MNGKGHLPLSTEDLPSATPPVKDLQQQQSQLRDAFYRALADQGYEARMDGPAVIAAREAYDVSVAQLLALLGTEAHCAEVDCDTRSAFSDAFKSESGVRPRGMHCTHR